MRTLALLKTLIEDAERELGTRASIGIGTPGAANPDTGLMRNSNSTCLNGQPLQVEEVRQPVRHRQVQGAALGVIGKGLEPVHRKAVANARRLSRTKLR